MENNVALINPLKIDSIDMLLVVILDAIVQIGSVFLVLAIVWVGFRFVSAQGNPGEIGEAKQSLMYTVIGGILLLGATAIGAVIKATVMGISP